MVGFLVENWPAVDMIVLSGERARSARLEWVQFNAGLME